MPFHDPKTTPLYLVQLEYLDYESQFGDMVKCEISLHWDTDKQEVEKAAATYTAACKDPEYNVSPYIWGMNTVPTALHFVESLNGHDKVIELWRNPDPEST